MITLTVKSIKGDVYEVTVSEQSTFHDVEVLIKENYALGQCKISFVSAGTVLDKVKTLKELKITEETIIRCVVQSQAPAPAVPAPAPQVSSRTVPPQTVAPQTVPTQAEPTQEVPTQAEPTQGATGPGVGVQMSMDPNAQNAAVQGYSHTYNGAEVNKALKRDASILFNVMHLIAKENPFFLSYMVVNPSLAQQHLSETLAGDQFVLTIKGPDETCDPIKPIIEEANMNHYEVDLSNVNYILQTKGLPQDDFARVKDLFLLHDRSVPKTLEELNPNTVTQITG